MTLVAGVACLLAFAVPPAAAVDFTATSRAPVAVDTLGTLFKVKILLSHNEADTVRFVIKKNAAVPIGWTASICVNGLCYADFVNEVPEESSYFLPGRVDTIATWFASNVNQGSGSAVITIAPADSPEEEVSFTLSAITTGVDLLIVDDDGGAAYDSVCAASLPMSMKAGTWTRSSAPLDVEELAKFPRVVWLTGEASPSLDAADRTAISGYLGGGGEMMLSGQNIAYSLCDPGSAEFSEEARDWLEETFHVAYEANSSSGVTVVGVPGDAIGDGLAFEIRGGTGADNQTSPDAVRAAFNGVECFTYGEVPAGAFARSQVITAGVRNATHCPTTVFLGFGFEGIAEATDRETLLDRVLGYMDAATPNPDSCLTENIPPVSNKMLSLSRNPFSPTGENPTMEFVVRVAPPAHARLEIFDISGRLVRTLLDREVTESATSALWDGADDNNEPVSSGVYFARLTSGSETATERTVLLK
jgi:hypothetical protein